MARRPQKPKYLRHSSGQARVIIDGRTHYLGTYGSPESKAQYDKLVAGWLINHGDVIGAAMTIDELALAYMAHAELYYRKNGKPTYEVANIRVALRPLVKRFGTLRASDFGPRKLKLVRDDMIRAKCVRSSINRQIGRLKRMFRWAASEEMLPAAVHAQLMTVDGLRRGRSEAIEAKPVMPVSSTDIDAIKSHVSRQVWAMVQLQLLTGMRPGEVRIMRQRDLDTTGDVWEYRPDSHKTEHLGRERVVFLGVKAQEIVQQFEQEDPEAYLFSPQDARRESDERRSSRAKTPRSRKRTPASTPTRVPGKAYTNTSYGRAISRACEAVGIEPWAPNRLRHTAATAVRSEFGLEAAQVILGHATASVTQVYAERDLEAARKIAAQRG